MSIVALRNALPGYAEDLKRNLDTLAGETALTDQQKWGAFLAAAYALGVPLAVRAIEKEAVARLSAEARTAAKAAAAVVAQNMVYYSAVNLLTNHDYRAQPAKLSMHALGHPSVDKIDFELWSLAVSAAGQCGPCLNAHEAELHRRNVALERIHGVLRIAAVVSAVSVVLRAEAGAA